MSTITQSRKPVKATKPTSGKCRWLLKPVWPKPGEGERKPGVLLLNGTEYLVEPIRCDGFRLTKPDGTVYDLDTTQEPWVCDCPDATFHPERPDGCKHAKGLRAALPALWK